MVRVALKELRANLRRLAAAASAVVLGVGFLMATLVVGDTMRGGFADTFSSGNEGTAVVVRSEIQLGDDEAAVARGLVPAALLDDLLGVRGVESGAVHVEGLAQIIGSDGAPLGGDGPPTLAANWITDQRLTPWELAEGQPPASEGEVVIDRASAKRGGLGVGSSTVLRTPDPVPVTVVGLATFAGEDSQGPTTQTLFHTRVAQELLLGEPGQATSLRLAAAPDVDHDELAARVASVLPSGLEALTGAERAAEQLAELESDFIGFFQALLLVFAGIGLVVATLTIHNTFTISVAQRTRQSALLRALGASRRQVISALTIEALVVGAMASAVGVGFGLGLAALALWGLDVAGFGVPGAMRWSTTSLTLAIGTGVAVALAAAVTPALSASRVPPLAAVRTVATEQTSVGRARTLAAVALAAVAAAAVIAAGEVGGSELSLTSLGVMAAVGALVLLGPALVPSVAAGLGWPIAVTRGRVGLLARRNALRNPRRTAGTSTSLTVGVGVAVLFAVLASSLATYIERTVDRSFTGDLVIDTDSFSGPGLPSGLASAVGALDEVEVAVGAAAGLVRIDERVHHPTVTDPVALDQLLDLGMVHGNLAEVRDDELAISTHLSDQEDWSIGDVLEVHLGADADPTTLTVVATYRERDIAGDLLINRATWGPDRIGSPELAVLIGLAGNVDADLARSAVARVAEEHHAPPPLDRAEYTDRIAGEIQQMLAVVFALLAIAIVIAVLGIGNTMSLSVHERTRELGLLRAVGMTRRGVGAMVRWESVIVAGLGSLVGVGLGTFGAWATIRALGAAEELAIPLAFPVTTMVLIGVLGASTGVIASFRPARRATRLDVLTAIERG